MTKAKKIMLSAAALVLTAAIGLGAALLVRNSRSDIVTLEQVGVSLQDITLISHRGFAHAAPENTVESIGKAKESGYTHAEFDVRRTSDGVWVAMHDSDIKRTTGGKGEVNRMTYKQLMNYPIDKGNNLGDYGLITVPTLENMLAACSNAGLTPVVEIKEKGTEHLDELLRILSLNYRGNFTVIAFERAAIEYVQNAVSSGRFSLNAELYQLVSSLDEEVLSIAAENTKIGLSFNANKCGTQEEIAACKQLGLRLACWTVDNPQRLKELFDLGVTTFTTNKIVPEIIPETTAEPNTEAAAEKEE